MNRPQVPVFLPSKEPPSHRPPAVGEEVRIFHDILVVSSRTIEHHSPKSTEASTNRTMEYHKPSSDKNPIEASSNPSPPPAYRWAQSLPSLLDDHQGVDLFREFLKQEGHETRSLDFRFGARGLKKADPNDTDKVRKIIHVLYEKMVRRIPSITQGTKDDIKRKLSCGVGVDTDIFDAAQGEVEAYMRKTTYPNFLNSDLYIQHLETSGKGRDCLVSPEAVEQLPTLHEDKEFNCSQKKIDFKAIFQRKRRSAVKCKTEAQAGFLNSPSAPYHTSYAPFLPASARDSELQSISSGMQTDDSMSQTDSSVTKPKRQQKVKYPFPINRDNLSHSIIPITSQPLPKEAVVHQNHHEHPDEFVADLTKRLLKAKEQLKNEEKFREKLKSVEANDSLKSESFARQRFPYVPEEDNDQAILDQHISNVFPDTTPTFSPNCATPPAPPPSKGSDDSARAARCIAEFNLPQDLSCGLKVVPSPFSVPFTGRIRRDPDTRSNDSGALADWVSEDNLPQCHRNSEFESASYDNQVKRAREKLKSKKFSPLGGSSSSCFDSGVSTACDYVQSVHPKIANWMETKRCTSEAENDRQGKTSPVLSRSSSSRKAVAYNSSRSESGPSQWTPFVQSRMPMDPAIAPPDTTTTLREAARRMEDDRAKMGKSKYISTGRSSHDAARGKVSSRAFDTVEDGISHRKQSKKSFSSGDGGASSSGDMTIIGYSYGLDSVPFKSRLPGKNITLKQFKTLLNKRGNFRYFFKSLSDDFGTKVVLDEVTDDLEILPLWEGKVFCIIESMDDGSSMNDD